MQKKSLLFFHRITYRPIIISLFILLVISSTIFGVFQIEQDKVVAILFGLFILTFALLGAFESTVNIKYFLNINLNRNAYLIGEFIHTTLFTILATLFLYGNISLLNYFKVTNVNLPIYLYAVPLIILFGINRFFFVLGLFIKKIVFIIIKILFLITVILKPSVLLFILIMSPPIFYISGAILIFLIIILGQLIISLKIRSIDLFK